MASSNRLSDQLTLYLSVLMAIAYLAAGIALAVTTQSLGVAALEGPLRYVLAGLLIIYGAFRGIRAYQRYRELNS